MDEEVEVLEPEVEIVEEVIVIDPLKKGEYLIIGALANTMEEKDALIVKLKTDPDIEYIKQYPHTKMIKIVTTLKKFEEIKQWSNILTVTDNNGKGRLEV